MLHVQADRSIESLYEQLVASGIAGPSPARHMADYVGAFAFLGTMLAKAKNARSPSLPQIRQAITEFALLPLGSQYAWDRYSLFLLEDSVREHHHSWSAFVFTVIQMLCSATSALLPVLCRHNAKAGRLSGRPC